MPRTIPIKCGKCGFRGITNIGKCPICKSKEDKENKANRIIGGLIAREKYQFIPSALLASIVRDTVDLI